jgi:hypothetical protein
MVAHVHRQRVLISGLLLLVQALGLGHLALADHAIGEAGAFIEVVQEGESGVAEFHSESAPHMCEHKVVRHADGSHACMVVAGWTTAAMITWRKWLVWAVQSRLFGVTASTAVAMQFDVLSRAPKASPPQD